MRDIKSFIEAAKFCTAPATAHPATAIAHIEDETDYTEVLTVPIAPEISYIVSGIIPT